MKLLTLFVAWLIGYYYEQCPICERGVAILGNGRIIGWCSRKRHETRTSAPVTDPR